MGNRCLTEDDEEITKFYQNISLNFCSRVYETYKNDKTVIYIEVVEDSDLIFYSEEAQRYQMLKVLRKNGQFMYEGKFQQQLMEALRYFSSNDIFMLMIQQPNTIETSFVQKVFQSLMTTLLSFDKIIGDPQYTQRIVINSKMKIIIQWPQIKPSRKRLIMLDVIKRTPIR